MVRGQCATSSGGRGEGSGRRSTPNFAPPPPTSGLTLPQPSVAGMYTLICMHYGIYFI
ncbi:hypothetical protein Taro_012731 [Colocasia esculenta]|uniref:Uncharacterized protein n=1 Tax=Colocasia esculenta TaxID=4460 RepID=A0A843UGK5_COLES|nr:hypothetical protein [Colocasia esculenta]